MPKEIADFLKLKEGKEDYIRLEKNRLVIEFIG